MKEGWGEDEKREREADVLCGRLRNPENNTTSRGGSDGAISRQGRNAGVANQKMWMTRFLTFENVSVLP